MSEQNLRVFGIDLGTTYSAVAYVNESGQPTVCRNVIENTETTPSVVFFESESNVVIGSVARDSAIAYPDRVVSLIKRQMGTEATFEFDGMSHTPESISALILKQLAKDAAEYTRGEVSKVVITVPAYFGMLEKDATKNAGKIAGLDVIGIVPEPVAAALHYEATTDAQDKTILVYDLGGGTFDTTVIRVSTNEIVVVCTDGDDHLGGADWDVRLKDVLLGKFREAVPPGSDFEDDEQFLQSLAIVAEDTKKQLSTVESRPVPLRGAGVGARVAVSRAEFEAATDDLLDKTIEIVKRTLVTLEEKSPGATIDDVLLVGGSTKMPVVAQRLHTEFGWEPRLHDPDLAVAKGAALYALGRVVHRELETVRQQAGSESDAQSRVSEVVEEVAAQTGISTATLESLAAKETRNVLPKAFGVKLVDTSDPDWRNKPEKLYVEHLVHANDPLPTGVRDLQAATLEDGQRKVVIQLCEQSGVVAGPDPAENKDLDKGTIECPPGLPAGSPVDIQLQVDHEGLLILHATERSTGKDLEIKVRVSVLNAEQVDQATKIVSGITVSS